MLQTVATNMIHNINRCWWRAGWLRLSPTVGSELNGCAATEPDSLRPANCFAATVYANLDVYDCLHRVGWLRCDWLDTTVGSWLSQHSKIGLLSQHIPDETVHKCFEATGKMQYIDVVLVLTQIIMLLKYIQRKIKTANLQAIEILIL